MAKDILHDAKMTARWGREAADAFKVAQERYHDESDFTQQKNVRIAPNRYDIYLEVIPPFTESMRKSGYDALNNLRNALDQATSAAGLAFNTAFPKKCAFPNGKNRKDFEKSAGSGPSAGLPSDVVDVIRHLEPWWKDSDGSGNEVLRDLIHLANPNKHQLPLTPVSRAAGSWIGGMVGIKRFQDLAGARPVNGRLHFATLEIEPYGGDLAIKPRIDAEIELHGGRHMDAASFFSEAATQVDQALAAIEAIVPTTPA